jgi:hypothetical protein
MVSGAPTAAAIKTQQRKLKSNWHLPDSLPHRQGVCVEIDKYLISFALQCMHE